MDLEHSDVKFGDPNIHNNNSNFQDRRIGQDFGIGIGIERKNLEWSVYRIEIIFILHCH